jgi:hypothetical protein
MNGMKKAIAEVADCKPSDLVKQEWDHYGLALYRLGRGQYAKQYAVGTDEEADAAVEQYIRDSVWAFNASFLAEQTNLPEEIFTALQDRCEGANDAFVTLIERSDGGMDDFVANAISADGRGHFLAGYDGEEHEVQLADGTNIYVYRVD